MEEETAGALPVVGATRRQLCILLLSSVGVRTAIPVVSRITGRTSRQQLIAGEVRGVGVPNLIASDTAHGPVVGAHVVSDVHKFGTVAVSITEGGHDELVVVDGAAHGHGD